MYSTMPSMVSGLGFHATHGLSMLNVGASSNVVRLGVSHPIHDTSLKLAHMAIYTTCISMRHELAISVKPWRFKA